MTVRTLLEDMFHAALNAADPLSAITAHLPEKPKGRVVVVGAGKASARMAQAVESAWGACEGLVIVPHGSALHCEGIRICEAAHPIPDKSGETAAREILSLLKSLTKDDFALCLISGGGSSLMALPSEDLNLSDKQLVNKMLLASGAAIDEMNVIRQSLSSIKGGRLAVAAAPARILTLVISDVPGDAPETIASGPTVPAINASETALELAKRLGIDFPDHIAAALSNPAAKPPERDHPAFSRAETRIVAAPQASLEAAAEVARKAGVTPVILGDAIEGEAREVGKVMAGIAAQVQRHGQPASGKVALISGGETTVTVKGTPGKGGRCSEFLLGLATAAWDTPNFAAIACDTDGKDGSENNAGAIWLPEHRAKASRLKARDHLTRHDAYSYFESLNALINTGPTHTNVNDFRVVYVETQDAD